MDGLVNLIVMALFTGAVAGIAILRERAKHRAHLRIVRRVHGAPTMQDDEPRRAA